jgi:hypothetical protein
MRSRPRRRAAEQSDELAPGDHSMTSSVRARTVIGMSMPSADQLVLLQHRHGKHCTRTAKRSDVRSAGLCGCSAVGRVGLDVDDLDRLLCRGCPSERSSRVQAKYWDALSQFTKRLRRIVHRDGTEAVAFGSN